MESTRRKFIVGMSLTAMAAGLHAACGGMPIEDADPLVVHEWGTFTTMQGFQGATLEGLQHEAEPLPAFVHSRIESRSAVAQDDPSWTAGVAAATPAAEASPTPPCRQIGKGMCVPVEHVTTKMETPVVYFYSKGARHVRLHVDFPNGLLSQWFPETVGALPEGIGADGRPLDLTTVPTSSLEWDVDLLAADAGAPAEMPRVRLDEPWQFAREVRANYLRANGEADRYLFYRGLGRLDLPVRVEAASEDRAVVINDFEDAIPAAFVVQMGQTDGRFVEAGAIAGGASREVTLEEVPRQPVADVVEALKGRVVAALIAQGLYEDEATAMVRTWSRTWFGSEGTRVLYLVPRTVTDVKLPMAIEPAPSELVRVLVGRLEYLTPGTEQEIATALRDRFSSDPEARAASDARLARFGRFLEPAVRRVMATNSDPVVQASGAALIGTL
jgi:hypothetical protein